MIVDAAAFVPTSRLDLSAWKPDFVPISFYKMFGYPTGLGALLARRAALARLQRPWFSGGTVVAANVQGEMVVPLSGHALFEDGTVNYLGIPAIEIGLRHLERIGIDTISRRVEALGTWLLEALQRLRHSDGSPATRIYGPTTWERRGGTIAFNFLHPDGRVVDERFVDVVAAAHRISVRTGCFCNSGAGETAFSISKDTLIGAEFADGMILDDYIRLVGMPTGGAVRVSLGLATNFADVYRFMTVRDGVPRRHRGARGPAAPARLLDAGAPAGRAGAAPAAAPPSGRGGSRRGRRASRRPRRGRAARTASLRQHQQQRPLARRRRSPGTGRRRSGSRSRTPGPGPASPTRMRRPPRTITFSTAPFIVT